MKSVKKRRAGLVVAWQLLVGGNAMDDNVLDVNLAV